MIAAAAPHADLPASRHPVILTAIALLHLLAFWGLLQSRPLARAVTEPPLLVALLSRAEQAPRLPEPALPSPPPRPLPALPAAAPVPVPAVLAPAAPEVSAAAAVPGPAPVEAPAHSAPAPASPAAAAIEPPPPAAPPAPRLIPSAALQLLEPLAVDYPRASRRNAEAGETLVRAFVDRGGVPRSLSVERSSGFVRLDQAALAAVQRARFRPYAENGQPVDGWALIPIRFELEK